MATLSAKVLGITQAQEVLDAKNDETAYIRSRNLYRGQIGAHVKIPKGDSVL